MDQQPTSYTSEWDVNRIAAGMRADLDEQTEQLKQRARQGWVPSSMDLEWFIISRYESTRDRSIRAAFPYLFDD